MLKPPPPPLLSTFCVTDNDRAVRMVKNLRCANCQRELTADDISTDLFGGIALTCDGCGLLILAVS